MIKSNNRMVGVNTHRANKIVFDGLNKKLIKELENVKKIKHGLVLTCIGDGGKFTYKKSRRNNSEIDETVPRILNNEKYILPSPSFNSTNNCNILFSVHL